MPTKQITDAFVRNVRLPNPEKGKRQLAYLDTMERGLALVLVVSYGGSKTFRALTYRNGKAHTIKLGIYPQMSVKEAREKARAYFHDPATYTAQTLPNTFKEVADNWVKRHVEAHGLRSAHEIKRQLDKYVYPKWKDRKFLELRRGQVNDLLDSIADQNGRKQADAVLATIRAIMTWYQSRNEHYTSPIVKGMRKSTATARKRILNDNEVRTLWHACTDLNGTYGALLKVLLLTGQRRDKVTTLRWDDLIGEEWVIRAEQREKGNAGKLTLPPLVREIIAQQPKIAGNPYVFPGRGRGPFNSFSQRKQELDAKLPDSAPWVLHDLRRTARSLLARAGVLPHICERVLGHAIAGVEGVYDRHPYDAEKADALLKLATLVQTIINPPEGNVVPLRRG
jgi:integrase